jgi:hypothetical protein
VLGRRARDWRVGHSGRDALYYEERHEGVWRRLPLDGEAGRPHHAIYFGSKVDWAKQPEWARDRRDEILARIKQAFPITEYAYEGEGVFDAHNRALLIEHEGGPSSEECVWAGCTERALNGRRVCITHMYPPEVWSDLGRPTSAST